MQRRAFLLAVLGTAAASAMVPTRSEGRQDGEHDDAGKPDEKPEGN